MRTPAPRAGCALLLASTLAVGCGAPPRTTAYREATYKRDRLHLVPFAFLPVPLAGPRAEAMDRGMERAFADTPGVTIRNQPTILRQRMNGDHDLVWLVNRVLAVKYSARDLAAGPNLQAILTGKQMEDLRTVTSGASMLLVPVEMATKPAGQATRGHALYRVYDLDSGRLLLQNTVDVSVPETGEAGDRKALVQVVLAMQQDLTQRLLD
jgi:hypothetical protein